jgi:hypothetical protein
VRMAWSSASSLKGFSRQSTAPSARTWGLAALPNSAPSGESGMFVVTFVVNESSDLYWAGNRGTQN